MQVTTANTTAQSRWPLIGSLVLIGGAVLAYFLIPGYEAFIDNAYRVLTSGDEARISSWVQQYGAWGPLFIVLITVAQMFLLVVNVMLVVLVAILAYGPWWGALLSVVSIVIASTIGYLIGRTLGPYTVYRLIGKESERKVEAAVERYGLGAVVLARISPFLSNDAISFVAGLVRMGYWRFMGATLAGIVPLVGLVAWLSEDMERLKTGLVWVSSVSLLGFVAYVVYDRYY
jgi:uncharacterized membrane protein YdjX (TVP38/TMEM64 family)